MIKKIIKNNTGYDKTILVVGVFHGDEEQGEFFINEYLKRNYKNGKNRMVFVPRLNKSKKRQNPRGVDLNRNFPTKNWELSDSNSDYYGGSLPNSEIETKFMVNLISEFNFDAIITIHSPFKIVNFDCQDDNKECHKLAQIVSDYVGYPIQKDIGYPTPGSFGTYCGIERNIPTITVEVDEEVEVKELLPNFIKLFKYLEFEY